MTKTNQLSTSTPMFDRSAYIHIPFCEHICYYCDFNKVFLEGQPVDEYIQSLLKEISTYASIVSRTRNENHLYWRRHANFIISETVRCATKRGSRTANV